jgi:hypothetical protein
MMRISYSRVLQASVMIALATVAGCGGSGAQPASHPAVTQQSSGPTAGPPSSPPATPQAAAIAPGHGSPQDAADGLIQNELAGNMVASCAYIDPGSQSACQNGAGQADHPTGTAKIDGAVISGNEALVEVTGSICSPGSDCQSNTNPALGMPTGSKTFAQAYSQQLGGTGFSPITCIKINGLWYVNPGQN